eukprot:gene25082-46035_t
MTALTLSLMAARAHGLAILDGVFNDIGDADGCARQCAQAAQWGFDGKTLIHPGQIDAANHAFTPDAVAVAWARTIVAAFDAPETRDKGVLKVEGRMVERLHLAEASRHVRINLFALALAVFSCDGARSQTAEKTPLTDPVHINDAGRSPDGPPTAADTAYDSRLRSSMASARAFQGPLDGSWTLVVGPRELYRFQLADRNGVVEGAWRDPTRPGALEASGYVDQIERASDGLTLRFGDQTVVLRFDAPGRFNGELKSAAGVEEPEHVANRTQGCRQ